MSSEIVKIPVSPRDAVVPRTPVLIGSMAGERANFITAVTVGWICFDTIAVSLGREQFSTECIRENMVFSVNFPTVALVEQLDYCGMNSGRNIDKSQLFTVHCNTLEKAPMIAECPVTFSCNVSQIIEKPKHAVFMGEIVDSLVHESCMAEGMADVQCTQPLLFSRIPGEGRSGAYYSLGKTVGKAWDAGKRINCPSYT